jgi:hypothetical protein
MRTKLPVKSHENAGFVRHVSADAIKIGPHFLVLPGRIELTTSPLPRFGAAETLPIDKIYLFRPQIRAWCGFGVNIPHRQGIVDRMASNGPIMALR